MNTTRQKFMATRAHYPTVPASRVLAAIRNATLVGPTEPGRFKVHSYKPSTAYNPRNKDSRGQLIDKRWIEDTRRAGLRFVGFADELAGLRHTGWFTDEFGDTLYRGAVWQLPARDGAAVYVAGYCDPNNDGAAYVDFEPIYGEHGGNDRNGSEDMLRDAARAADSIAEHAAEQEREYQDKANAAIRLEELREELQRARGEHSMLVRGIARGVGDDPTGARMRERIRNTAAKIVRQIRELIDQYGADTLREFA